jgi:uncharacterized protein YhaN
MKLQRVEAVRYGGFTDARLGEFKDGLAVILGSNEAGKSTFTSLVRHVLYGFPRGRTNERLYQPPSGDHRVGRLLFVDGKSKYVVERTEGAHGGEVSVHGPQGEEPGGAFLETLTRGVSATIYRSVFAFALEELSDLASLEGIQSRLYATTAGLRVNPHDVLEKLQRRADDIWAPRARTKQLHKLNTELRAVREERRRLEELSERYRTDRERLAVVSLLLDQSEVDVRTLRLEEERLTALLAEGRRLVERMQEDEQEAAEQRLEAEKAQREVSLIEVDEALLEHRDELDRLGARFELFVAEAGLLREDEGRLGEVDSELLRRAADLGDGWTVDAAAAFPLDLELENRLEEMEERIRDLRRERDDCARRSTESRTELKETQLAAEACAEELGLDVSSEVEVAVGVRLETIDRLISLTVAAGLVLENLPLTVAGVLPAALAGVLLVLAWLGGKNIVSPEVENLLPVLGLEVEPSAAELMEMRNLLEACHGLWATVGALARSAAARETAAREAVDRLDKMWQEWLQWLDEHGLRTSSDQPASVRRILRELRELRGKVESRRQLEEQIIRRRSVCEEFVDDAGRFGVVPEDESGSMGFEDVRHGVRTLLTNLAAARRAFESRREINASRVMAEERAVSLETRVENHARRLSELIESAGVPGDGALSDLEAAAAVARRQTAESEEERDGLIEERATLDGKLQRGAEESASAELRLREAGLVERVATGLEEFAIATVAAKMLEEALGAYEAERQPAVIRRAQDLFSSMTEGRYTHLGTPLGQFSPSVTEGDSPGKAPDRLSRATAEQLFLALRLSYIENLAGAHPALPVLMDDVLVNFDDQRRRAAVRVIAEFADRRQVIFFTCHPATAKCFKAEAGKHTLVKMA